MHSLAHSVTLVELEHRLCGVCVCVCVNFASFEYEYVMFVLPYNCNENVQKLCVLLLLQGIQKHTRLNVSAHNARVYLRNLGKNFVHLPHSVYVYMCMHWHNTEKVQIIYRALCSKLLCKNHVFLFYFVFCWHSVPFYLVIQC